MQNRRTCSGLVLWGGSRGSMAGVAGSMGTCPRHRRPVWPITGTCQHSPVVQAQAQAHPTYSCRGPGNLLLMPDPSPCFLSPNCPCPSFLSQWPPQLG